MLYKDTDSFYLQLFVENLGNEINSRPQLRDAFYFSEIKHTHLSQLRRPGADVYGAEVSYFKDETKGDLIGEFFRLRPKISVSQ